MIVEKQGLASSDARTDYPASEPPPSYAPDPVHDSSSIAGPSRHSESDQTLFHGHPATPPLGIGTPVIGRPVNGLTVATHYESIKGTWLLDPFAATAMPSLLTSFVSHWNSRRGKRRERERGLAANLSTPAANLDSHFGAITVSLAIVGRVAHPARAGVKATTHHGNINIDVFEKAPSKFVDLDVHSQSGHVAVMIPRSFSGLVELESGQGLTVVLPYLSGIVHIVKAGEGEATILVGDASETTGRFVDRARIYSREGDVRVGLSGEDHYVYPEGLMSMVMRRVTQKI